MAIDQPGTGDQADVPPAVAALRKSLTDLINESKALRTDVSTAEAARRRSNQITAAALAVLCIFVGLLFVVVVQSNTVVKKVNSTNQTIGDCITPTGRCYQEGEARTQEALLQLIRAQVFMAECARLYPNEAGPAYDRKLETCVEARLKTQEFTRPGAPEPPPPPRPAPSASVKSETS